MMACVERDSRFTEWRKATDLKRLRWCPELHELFSSPDRPSLSPLTRFCSPKSHRASGSAHLSWYEYQAVLMYFLFAGLLGNNWRRYAIHGILDGLSARQVLTKGRGNAGSPRAPARAIVGNTNTCLKRSGNADGQVCRRRFGSDDASFADINLGLGQFCFPVLP